MRNRNVSMPARTSIAYQDQDLFKFEWARDKHGYELWPTEDSGGMWPKSRLRAKGGPLEFYRPLEEHPGLFRRFASITPRFFHPHHGHVVSHEPDKIVQFANEFGLLTGYWGRHEDEDEVEEDLLEDLEDWTFHIEEMRKIIKELDLGDRQSAADRFNELSIEPSWPGLSLFAEIKIARGRKNKRLYLNISPFLLLSSMYLQLASEITNNTQYKKCELCPNWFPFGPGTGHKQTKKFCSTRCRVAWNRRKADRLG